MTVPFLLVLFLFTLILSNILHRIFPKIPLPLIQILLGIVTGLLNRGTSFTLDSNLFLALVVAPLSFREGQESDVSSLVKYRGIISYLILPAVFVTTIGLGLAANYFLPASISMAACFALGQPWVRPMQLPLFLCPNASLSPSAWKKFSKWKDFSTMPAVWWLFSLP